MKVSIKTCPDCGAVVMGDESTCSACGKVLPVVVDPPRAPVPSSSRTEEVACPKCGTKVPRSVLRCRDCGAYMSVEIEAAMLAKQMTRGFAAPVAYRPLTSGGAGGLPGAAPASSFAEVADDADFDLVPNVDLLDVTAPKSLSLKPDEVALKPEPPRPDEVVMDDDFEMDQMGEPVYGVSDEVASPVEAIDAPAAPGDSASNGAAETASPLGDPATEIPHSIQTAGDVLLDAALAEERDAQLRQKGGHRRLRRSANTVLSPDTFVVFCPNGHRIQVHSKHRGRTGRCPNCKSLYFVPLADTNQTLGQAGGTTEGTAGAEGDAAAPEVKGYTRWITDVYLHRLNPAKLKLKAGSLVGEHEIADLGSCSEHLLLAVLFTGGGAFRGMQEAKKKAATREAMLKHLNDKMPLPDLPAPKHYPLSTDQLQQLKIVQPSVPGEESLFADIPVFGEGRIAIRIPAADASGERAYLSFTLSQFREFSTILAESFGLMEFGGGTSIPMTDDFTEAACHYTESVMRTLPIDKLPFYKADPALKLVIVGRRCQKCGLTVSEDGRKKEKIGGKSDSSVAKAKCPKCKSKFGDIALWGFSTPVTPVG